MKFLIFLTIIVTIWYVVRWVQHANASSGPRQSAFGEPRRRTMPRATDTILCARCGAYTPTDVLTACNRTDCPFPRAG